MPTDAEKNAAIWSALHDPLEQRQLSNPIPDYDTDEAASGQLLDEMAAREPELYLEHFNMWACRWRGGYGADFDRKRAIRDAAHQALCGGER